MSYCVSDLTEEKMYLKIYFDNYLGFFLKIFFVEIFLLTIYLDLIALKYM